MPASVPLLEEKLASVDVDVLDVALYGVTKAYVGTSYTGRVDYDQQLAAQGFERLGVAVEFVKPGDVPTLTRSELLVDGVQQVRRALYYAGRSPLPWNDYPPELEAFYGRKLERLTWAELNQRAGDFFVKKSGKGAFLPGVMRFPWKPSGLESDYNALHVDDETVLLVSEPVEFVAEWRAFCVDGQILDVRQYDGRWHDQPDRVRIAAASHCFRPRVRGYSIDFGLTSSGETLVVETNAGHSLGAYGLRPDLYARLIAAAWAGVWGEE